MNKLLHLIIILFLCTVSRNLLSQELYKDPDRTTDERIADLLSRMTTEEKIGQLCFPTGWEMYRKIDDHTAVPAESFIERMERGRKESCIISGSRNENIFPDLQGLESQDK
jgi:beta-glucosidase